MIHCRQVNAIAATVLILIYQKTREKLGHVAVARAEQHAQLLEQCQLDRQLVLKDFKDRGEFSLR